MSKEYRWQAVLAFVGALLLGLAWWGWGQSGLAFLHLGIGLC